MNGLDLFSGIGGISLALKPWVRTVAYCEQDRYCQGVLLSRMWDGGLDRAPIWDDVRTLRGDMFNCPVDIISGGFPCQDISPVQVRTPQKGLEGKRSGLFYEILRLATELRPTFIALENVSAIYRRGANEVISALAAIGYDCRWTTLSASTVGAFHHRQRFWLLAHPTGQRCEAAQDAGEGDREGVYSAPAGCVLPSFWGKENRPRVGGEIHGLPHRVDRNKALGNSVVPLCAREAFQMLSGLKEVAS